MTKLYEDITRDWRNDR